MTRTMFALQLPAFGCHVILIDLSPRVPRVTRSRPVRYVGREAVGGVSVDVPAGAVVEHGHSRVGVMSGDLRVAVAYTVHRP